MWLPLSKPFSTLCHMTTRFSFSSLAGRFTVLVQATRFSVASKTTSLLPGKLLQQLLFSRHAHAQVGDMSWQLSYTEALAVLLFLDENLAIFTLWQSKWHCDLWFTIYVVWQSYPVSRQPKALLHSTSWREACWGARLQKPKAATSRPGGFI